MPLQLQVVPLPNSSLAYTNHVYIAEPLLGPMLLIEDRACLSVRYVRAIMFLVFYLFFAATTPT